MVERGGNIQGILDVLKAQPLMLGLLLVIFSLIGFVYLQSAQFNTQRAENMRLILDVQKEAQKLLAQCVVPPSRQ